MECPGDIAWLCLSFPLLLPAFAVMVQAGSTSVDVDYRLWNTDFGVVEIAGIEETIVGRYPAFGGVLVMKRLAPERFEGVWIQQESDKLCSGPPELPGTPGELLAMAGVPADPRHWGRVRFDSNRESGSVDGAWGYCFEEPGAAGAWDGKTEARNIRTLRVPR